MEEGKHPTIRDTSKNFIKWMNHIGGICGYRYKIFSGLPAGSQWVHRRRRHSYLFQFFICHLFFFCYNFFPKLFHRRIWGLIQKRNPCSA